MRAGMMLPVARRRRRQFFGRELEKISRQQLSSLAHFRYVPCVSARICLKDPKPNIPGNRNAKPNASRKATSDAALRSASPSRGHGKPSTNNPAGVRNPVAAARSVPPQRRPPERNRANARPAPGKWGRGASRQHPPATRRRLPGSVIVIATTRAAVLTRSHAVILRPGDVEVIQDTPPSFTWR